MSAHSSRASELKTATLRSLSVLCGLGTLLTAERAWAACTNPPPGLVNWWRAENSGADSVGTSHGILLNGVSYADGHVGDAFNFDGTNGIVLLSTNALNALPAPWTAEFWVNRQASPEDSAVLLSDTNNALKLEQYPNTKRVGLTRWGIQDYSFNYTAPIGTWTHLVFVGSNSSTTLYVNGAVHSTLSVGIALPRTTMGRDITNRYNKALKGLLDEISVYNRALSAGEILALYNADSDGKCAPINCTTNDNFACRQTLFGSSFTNVINNEGSTREVGEPLHGNASGTNSIWYSWTAPTNGSAVIEAAAADAFVFESPIVAVYTGTSLATLSNVAFNFAPFNGSGSAIGKARVAFTAVAGQTYSIAVDGAPPANSDKSSGSLTISLILTPPPANDHFTNATAISGLFHEVTNATFRGASRETGEPTHGTNFGQTVWWTWTAPTNLGVSSIPVRLSADAVSHPPALGAYTGASVSTLTPVTGLISMADGMSRTATFTATAGVKYYFAVAGLQNDVESVLPLFGNFRYRFNTRALGISINNLVTNSSSTEEALNFTATASVTNSGSATSAPLRVLLTAVPGISMRGPEVLVLDELPQVLTNYLKAPLAPNQFTNFPIAGAAPAHTETPAGTREATGYGVHAELQEQVGTNWITVDDTLVVYGHWPELAGLPGPGGGVIRLDPGFIGGSVFDPLISVVVIGSPTTVEGQIAGYIGRARYFSGLQLDFTNTVWTSTLPSITNGLFRAGVINSNTIVTLSARFSDNGLLFSATTNVLVINLPSPALTEARRGGGNFRFRIDGVSNRVHVVEATTNLSPPQVWQSISTNTLNATGVWNFTNATGATPQRFYRAREVE
ncbi:MAG TPA: LamG domain-containing protein [Verrucomicrobiae bacterium]|nr:LamG domain-containing protein [Verrucomicrobiae bacterium]